MLVDKTEAKIICIVGMHRSGTSMIAQVLNQCGLYLGPPETLLKADATNPLGHFEHRGFLEIDRKLLKLLKATWREPPSLRPGWHLDPKLAPLLAEARALAATFAEKSLWGWKEPRASLFLPFWRAAIPNMNFVICIRNPLEVARSLEKRNRTPLKKGASLWYRYIRASIEDTEGCPRLFTFFDDYFDESAREVERLLRFCGLPTASNTELAQGAVAGDLRHHSSADHRLSDETVVSAESKNFYLGLRALLSNRAPYDEAQGEQESLKVSDLIKSQDEGVGSLSRTASQEEVTGVGRAARKIKRLLVSLKRS